MKKTCQRNDVIPMSARDMGRPAFFRMTTIIFIALLLGGAIVRIYGAWQLRYDHDPDSGVVALMVKHIAEGKDFPVFFYGQPYMGSLEPFVSAIFCALFGTSGFMVTLIPAFVGWLILLAVFVWARDAHSPAAGLAAMAWCMIGPTGFVHYQISPRCGYAVTILLTALILWLISRLIIKESNKCRFDPPTGGEESPPKLSVWRRSFRSVQDDKTRRTYDVLGNYGKWFLLGLLAGLGWWSNQLIIYAIFTAALLAFLFLRGRVFSLNTLSGAAGFFIGSLPFWWWNFSNDWQSFEFTGSFGQTSFIQGLKIFFIDRLPDLLDLNHGIRLWRIVGAAVYLGAAVFFISFLWKAFKTRHEKGIYLLTAFVFILVSILIFSASHFALTNTSRYILPLVPVIAVIFGVMTAELAKRKYFFMGLIPLTVVIANQAMNLSWLAERGAGEEKYQRRIEECGRFLKSQGILACYAPYGKHGWNFALREEICFCDLPLERYPPYVRRAELADKIAVLDNLGEISNFISNYGGSAKTTYSGGASICHDFVPPHEGLAAIPAEAIESIRDSLGGDILTEITDGNIDTGWEGALPEGDDEWLEIAFKTPQKVRMIRLLYSKYPETWQITGQGDDDVWKTLTPCIQLVGYLWSGPRPYWSFGTDGYRLECRMPPEKLKRLRIHRIQSGYHLFEMQLFSPAVAPESEEAALKSLVDLIRARNLKRLYCDRWPANAVFRETQGAVETWLNPNIFGDCSLATSNPLWFTPRTGILVREEDVPLCRRTLADRLVEMRQTKVGPWVLFDFSPCEALGRSRGEPGKWKPEYGRNFELHWAGFTCLAENNKRWAAELVDRADIQVAKGEAGDAIALLQKAGEAWPLYPPAVERLARLTAEGGNSTDAEYWKREYEKLQPETRAAIKFSNGIEFAGLALSTNTVSAGDSLTIRYYWKYPPEGTKGQPLVFVHFLNGENILQDDRPFSELFVETRTLIVPETAPEGEYQIRIGIYDASRTDQKRFNVKTELPARLNSVELPVRLAVIKKRNIR